MGDVPASVELSSALRVQPDLKNPGFADPADFAPPVDTMTAVLRELSAPEMERFLEVLEQLPTPEIAARLEDLIRASASAAAAGNVQQALTTLMEFAALDPRRAEALATEPGLAPIRAEVGRLLVQLASTAQADAELRLAQATHLLHTASPAEAMGQQIKPESAIMTKLL